MNALPHPAAAELWKDVERGDNRKTALLILADLYAEAGRVWAEECLRWCAENGRRPFVVDRYRSPLRGWRREHAWEERDNLLTTFSLPADVLNAFAVGELVWNWRKFPVTTPYLDLWEAAFQAWEKARNG